MGFRTAFAASVRYEHLGTAPIGTACPASTATSLGTTSFGWDGFYMTAIETAGASEAALLLVQAQNGSAFETIATRYLWSLNGSGQVAMHMPIRIPAGAQVQILQTNDSSTTALTVLLTGYSASGVRSFSRAIDCTDRTGNDPTNALTLTATTQTAWVQVCASTAARVAGLCVDFGIPAGHTGDHNAFKSLDIGFGASGSERVLFSVNHPRTAQKPWIAGTTWYPVDLPAGTRLAIRGQSNSSIDVDWVWPSLAGLVP
jgi:hypothetical protein